MKRVFGLFLKTIIVFSLSSQGLGYENSNASIHTVSKRTRDDLIRATAKRNTMDPMLRYILKKFLIDVQDTVFAPKNFIQQNPMVPLRQSTAQNVMIPVYVKSSNIDRTSDVIKENGGNVSTMAGDILVAEIPLRSIAQVVNHEETLFIESSKFYQSLLNVSHTEIEADKVHSGATLPTSYKGQGVIVGIVDTGIDWKHEDFKNETGSKILYLWDMSGDTNPPSGYDYGTEYTKEQIDSQLCQEEDSDDGHGHGTHVSATATGNGNALSGYTGIAPSSDILFVKALIEGAFHDKNVIDGCNYIFSKAQTLAKPAVINLSLGGHSGPHDGTSLSEQAYSNLTGSGRIIVAAAGNEGSSLRHLSYTTRGTDFSTSLKTYWFIPDTAIFSGVDMWYDRGNISVGIAAYDSNFQLVGYSDAVAPGEEIFFRSFRFNDQTYGYVSIDATTTADPNNNAKRVNMHIDRSQRPLDEVIWALYTFGSGTFDAWISSPWGSFSEDYDPQIGIMPGDNDKSIGSPATGKKVICVGSYVTKVEWIDIDGKPQTQLGPDKTPPIIGEVSYFSSMGPTRDGRLKPDVVAPGEVILAALSSDLTAAPRKNILWGGKHQRMRGTSMACPHVTGTVALLLEANPILDYHYVYEILTSSAVKDDLTGAQANNIYGNGKLNALNAVQEIIPTRVENEEIGIPTEYALFQNYPNPFNFETTITYRLPEAVRVRMAVYNTLGQRVDILSDSQQEAGFQTVTWNGKNASSGIYLYRMKAGDFVATRRMVLLK